MPQPLENEPLPEDPKKPDSEEIVELKNKVKAIDVEIKRLDDISHQYGIRQMIADSQIVSLTEDLDEAKKKMSELEEREQKRKGEHIGL